jgi:hypothetical protein
MWTTSKLAVRKKAPYRPGAEDRHVVGGAVGGDVDDPPEAPEARAGIPAAQGAHDGHLVSRLAESLGDMEGMALHAPFLRDVVGHDDAHPEGPPLAGLAHRRFSMAATNISATHRLPA